MESRRTNSRERFCRKSDCDSSLKSSIDWDLKATVKASRGSALRPWNRCTTPSCCSEVSTQASIDVAALLGRIAALEKQIEAMQQVESDKSALLQATVKALKADNDALKEENRIVTEVMREWEKKEQREWVEMKTRLEDSIRMLEDQLAVQTEEKVRLERHFIDLEARHRLCCKCSDQSNDLSRVSDLEAEVQRLRLLIIEKDEENDRMVHRLHAFMLEAETAKKELRTFRQESKGRLTPTTSISRTNSFVEKGKREGKSARCSPILQKRQASVGRFR